MVVSFVNCRIAANSRPANGVCQDYIAPTLPTEIRPPGTNPRILRIVQAFRRPVRLDAPHDVLRPLVNDDVPRLDVKQRLVRMRMLRVLAVAVLVDPGDELLRCWAFQVEEKGVNLHGGSSLTHTTEFLYRSTSIELPNEVRVDLLFELRLQFPAGVRFVPETCWPVQ